MTVFKRENYKFDDFSQTVTYDVIINERYYQTKNERVFNKKEYFKRRLQRK